MLNVFPELNKQWINEISIPVLLYSWLNDYNLLIFFIPRPWLYFNIFKQFQCPLEFCLVYSVGIN